MNGIQVEPETAIDHGYEPLTSSGVIDHHQRQPCDRQVRQAAP